MKEVNKLKKIYKGFFPDETVSEQRLSFRREACYSCPYMSANVDQSKLSTIDAIRTKAINQPFCTLCKCQIAEKTQSPYEECAAYKANEPIKWFKTRLEMSKDHELNLTNLSETEVNLYLDDGNYVVDYGEVTVEDSTELDFKLDVNSKEEFKVVTVNPTCGCTATKFNNEDGTSILSFKIDIEDFTGGVFKRAISVEYTVGGKPYKNLLILKGFKK